ncbi:ImmA/IrrE family metallo-endopeptidase [Bacillus wiedmannii]|uniref:ImmA/IrrE family metallo-endopeptidase n=1 Tax=Bacillus wiedmannii TaxID=1890302 RepID=A0A4U2MYZ5_9BACI|nr:XRE family transcriptional regulator [Bacillus wiedmannii]TKH16584.1 ImmA/IrrE family metallo-endopeptidase [Bacillus wiedmannii]
MNKQYDKYSKKRMLFSGKFQFNGKKLKLAREIRSMTTTELAGKIDVSHQMISKYEKGENTPQEEKIKLISQALQFPRTFFFTSYFLENNDRTSPDFFRKGAAVAKKYQIQVEANTTISVGIKKYLESKLKLPKFTMPNFALVQKEFRQLDFDDIEDTANALRDLFNLKRGPIGNITLLCERMGIGVFFADLDSTKIDAHTVFVDNTPYIILNKERKSSVRMRFNIAHELGHILLHSQYQTKDVANSSNHKRIEDEANHFAGCLLLPGDGLALDMAASNLTYLISLKKHWKASIQAIIYRSEQLGLFSSNHTLHLRQQISRNSWRKFEPLDDEIPIEEPQVLKQAIQVLLKNNIITVEELEMELGLTIEMIQEYCLGHNCYEAKEMKVQNNVVSLF